MLTLTKKQMTAVLAERAEHALAEQLAENAELPKAWWRLMAEEIWLEEIGLEEITATTEGERVEAVSMETAAAWKRARHLFFSLLPEALDELRGMVAAQIEREFNGLPASDVADNLRSMQRGTLLQYRDED